MATLLVTSNPTSLSGARSIFELGTGTFSIAGSANVVGTTLYYQWEKTSNVLGSAFVNVGTLTTSNTLNIVASAAETIYVRCGLSAGSSTRVYSASASLVSIVDRFKQFAANGEAGTPRRRRLVSLSYV